MPPGDSHLRDTFVRRVLETDELSTRYIQREFTLQIQLRYIQCGVEAGHGSGRFEQQAHIAGFNSSPVLQFPITQRERRLGPARYESFKVIHSVALILYCMGPFVGDVLQ